MIMNDITLGKPNINIFKYKHHNLEEIFSFGILN